MADNKVEFDIGMNTSSFLKGLEKIRNKLNTFGQSVKGIASLGNSITGLKSAFDMASGSIAKVSDAIKETIELSNKQTKAELQLETAAKNNPYLNDSNVKKLKEYAGQLQSISTTGDEELLPFMAQLAASGRTQAEIQDIMSAALDASASGMISLESAVQSLNRSYSGEIGMLGRLLPQTKELTSEQLKNGAAVEAIKKAYSGMANEVSSKTGGWQQFKNSLGDLKELIGKGFAESQNRTGQILSKFFDSITSKINASREAARKFQKELNIIVQNDIGNENISSLENEIALHKENIKLYEEELKAKSMTYKQYVNAEKEKLRALEETHKAEIKSYNDNIRNANSLQMGIENAVFEGNESNIPSMRIEYEKSQKAIETYNATVGKELEAQRQKVKDVSSEWKRLSQDQNENEQTLKYRIENENKALQENEKRLKELQKIENAQSDADKKRANLDAATKEIVKQREEYEKQKLALEEKASILGTEVDKMDLLNLKVQQYMNLWSSPSAKYATTELSNLKKEIEYLSKEIEVSSSFNMNDFMSQFSMNVKEEIENAKDILKDFYDFGIISKKEYNTKIKELDKDIVDLEKKNAEERKKIFLDVANTISNVVNNMAQTMEQMASLASKRAEDTATAETAALEKQFAEGEISEEEYYQRKEQIEKEAAQEKYKADLWAWSASLLQIGNSTALAIMQSLAQLGPVAGTIMAASIGVLGAAQTAVAMANKPVPPSFATGGFIGGMNGATMGADNTYIHARNGEWVVNAKQQKELWEVANGRGAINGASVANNVQIKNYRGNDTRVDTRFTEDGLKIFIRESVQDDQRNGRLRDSFIEQQNILDGIKYL